MINCSPESHNTEYRRDTCVGEIRTQGAAPKLFRKRPGSSPRGKSIFPERPMTSLVVPAARSSTWKTRHSGLQPIKRFLPLTGGSKYYSKI